MPEDFPKSGGCWPTPTQELLLRAALTNGEAAVATWREWQENTDIESLDHASRLLLPLLLRNLEAQGLEGLELSRYKSVSRHAWVQNQRLLDNVKRVVLLLEVESIATLVFQGAALVSLYYPEISTRPLNDVNVLVPAHQATRALELLLSRGYKLRDGQKSPRNTAAFSVSSVIFLEKSKGEAVALHQRALPDSMAAGDDEFWGAAIPLQIGDSSTRTLRPEDQLLLLCARAGRWSEVPPLRWVADATMILRTQPDFDWSRFVAQTQRHRLALPVGAALRYLQRPELELALPIPAEALSELAGFQSARSERREHQLLSRPSRPLPSKVWLQMRSYSRWNRNNARWKRPFMLPRYLQYSWGLNSLVQLPVHGLKRLLTSSHKSK